MARGRRELERSLNRQTIADTGEKIGLPRLRADGVGKFGLRLAPRKSKVDEPKRIRRKPGEGFDEVSQLRVPNPEREGRFENRAKALYNPAPFSYLHERDSRSLCSLDIFREADDD